MKTLIKNGRVVNVFTGELEKINILIEDEKIIGAGSYSDTDADVIHNVKGKYVCPGFRDGHIHIDCKVANSGNNRSCIKTVFYLKF